MPKKILVILGHPARRRQSLDETLARAYADAASKAGHRVEFLKIADLRFDPILHEGYASRQPIEPDITAARTRLLWADHWVIVYPLWQLMIPALLKGFCERTLARGFAYSFRGNRPVPDPRLAGKSARLIQTMAMPGALYRWLSGQHGAKALAGVLRLCGVRPVRVSYFGLAQEATPRRVRRFVKRAHRLGRRGG